MLQHLSTMLVSNAPRPRCIDVILTKLVDATDLQPNTLTAANNATFAAAAQAEYDLNKTGKN